MHIIQKIRAALKLWTSLETASLCHKIHGIFPIVCQQSSVLHTKLAPMYRGILLFNETLKWNKIKPISKVTFNFTFYKSQNWMSNIFGAIKIPLCLLILWPHFSFVFMLETFLKDLNSFAQPNSIPENIDTTRWKTKQCVVVGFLLFGVEYNFPMWQMGEASTTKTGPNFKNRNLCILNARSPNVFIWKCFYIPAIFQ